jgi:hypothetical protein
VWLVVQKALGVFRVEHTVPGALLDFRLGFGDGLSHLGGDEACQACLVFTQIGRGLLHQCCPLGK